ncbi:MAG TPA: hypothetical protein VNZ22_11275, partial [Bacillota bacterium]|nr:hypothetical protein [Bacillota bacterium]
MFEFLLKVWGLARPYRGRLLLGALTGVIGGLLEPLLIVTVAFVYGVIFPSANTSSALLTANDVKDAPALIARLSHPVDPLSQFLASQFTPQDWQALTNTAAGSKAPPPVLVQQLNHAVQCSSLYEPQRL